MSPHSPDTMQTPYPRSRRLRMESTIYGFCAGPRGAHYCFNRDYLILPVQLPPVALDVLKRIARNARDGLAGHGRLAAGAEPTNATGWGPSRRADGWQVYWLFDDGTAPHWRAWDALYREVSAWLQGEGSQKLPTA